MNMNSFYLIRFPFLPFSLPHDHITFITNRFRKNEVQRVKSDSAAALAL